MKIYLAAVRNQIMPIGYDLNGFSDTVTADHLIDNTLDLGSYEVIGGEYTSPTGEGYLFPILCEEIDGDLLPLIGRAFDEGVEVVGIDYTDDLEDDIKDIRSIPVDYSVAVDYKDIYSSYILSYQANLIRRYMNGEDVTFQEGENFQSTLASVKKIMEEIESDYYLNVYEQGVQFYNKQLNASKKQTESTAVVSETEVKEGEVASIRELEQSTKEEVASSETQPTPTDTRPISTLEDKVEVVEVKEEDSEISESHKVTEKKVVKIDQSDSVSFEKPEIKGFDEEDEEDDNEEVNFLRSNNYFVEKSGKCELVTDVTEEAVQKAAKQVAKVAEFISNLDEVPKFIPRVYKYEKPIGVKINGGGSILAGMKYDDFVSYIKMYQDNPSIIESYPVLATFVSEICYILRINDADITLVQVLGTLDESDSGNWGLKAFYELLKYAVIDESPNRLYDDMYPFLYIANLYISQLPASEEAKAYRLADIFSKLVTKVEKTKYETVRTEHEGDNDSLNSEGFKVDAVRRDINIANESIASLLTDTFTKSKKSVIVMPLPGGEQLTEVQKTCVLGRYGYSFTLKSEILAYQGLDILNVHAGEFALTLTYYGEVIDKTVLGDMIRRMQVAFLLRTEPKYADKTDAEFIEAAKEEIFPAISYNKIVRMFKNPKFTKYIEKRTANAPEVEDLRTSNYVFNRLILCKYTHKDGRKAFYPIAFIIEDKMPGVSPLEKFKIFPVISSTYGIMKEVGVTIPGFLEDDEDLDFIKFVKDNNDLVQPLYKATGNKARADKSKLAVVTLSEPVYNLPTVRAILKSVKISGIEPDALVIPKWTNYDSLIGLGYKMIFGEA